MLTLYPELNPDKLDIQFISLYRDEATNQLQYEIEQTASDLMHNAIMPGI